MKVPRPNLTKSDWINLTLFLLTLLSMMGFVAWASYEIRDLRTTIHQINLEKPRDGKDGITKTITITETLPAEKPQLPKEPVNGKDGKNATDEQVAKAVADYMTAHPVQNGQDGKNGITILIRFNFSSHTTECKFVGDDTWQPIEECG